MCLNFNLEQNFKTKIWMYPFRLIQNGRVSNMILPIHHLEQTNKCPFLYWCGFINKTLKRLFLAKNSSCVLIVVREWTRGGARRRGDYQSVVLCVRVCACVCVWVVCVYLCSCQALWPITRSPAFRWFTIVEIPFLTYTTLLFQRPDPSSTTELHQLLISLLQRKKRGGGQRY